MKSKPKHGNAGNKHAQRGPARRVPVFVRLDPAALATLKHQAAARGLSQSDTVIRALNVLKSSMTSIHITDAQAEILDRACYRDNAIRLNAETLTAGSRCTELRNARDKMRRGSAEHTAAADALFDAQATHAELERRRDSAWAVANSSR